MVRSSLGMTPPMACSIGKVTARVSTDWPAFAGRWLTAVTVPEKIVPRGTSELGQAESAGRSQPSPPEVRLDGMPHRGLDSRGRQSGNVKSRPGSARSDWPSTAAGSKIRNENASRQAQLLPNTKVTLSRGCPLPGRRPRRRETLKASPNRRKNQSQMSQRPVDN